MLAQLSSCLGYCNSYITTFRETKTNNKINGINNLKQLAYCYWISNVSIVIGFVLVLFFINM